MMWFYLSAYVVLFGAELNAALDREWRHLHHKGGAVVK
jgi:membrane protein